MAEAMSAEALPGGSKAYSAALGRLARIASSVSAWGGVLRICVAAVLIGGVAGSALAKENLLTPQINNKEGSNQPLLLQADELVYDNKNSRIIAKGNVEVYYKNYALLSDEL